MDKITAKECLRLAKQRFPNRESRIHTYGGSGHMANAIDVDGKRYYHISSVIDVLIGLKHLNAEPEQVSIPEGAGRKIKL